MNTYLTELDIAFWVGTYDNTWVSENLGVCDCNTE